MEEKGLPPRDEEVWFYYEGLPSKPWLIARSNEAAWQRLTFGKGLEINPAWPPEKAKRQLRPIGSHPIVQKWDHIKEEIISAAKTLAWTSIDVLRLGYVTPPANHENFSGIDLPPFNDLRGCPVVLISVTPKSCSWEEGYKVVKSCQSILNLSGLTDVHCEVKESRLFRSATGDNSPPFTLTLDDEERGQKAFIEKSLEKYAPEEWGNLKNSISYNLGLQGAKGLFLKPKGAQVDTDSSVPIYLLTCRHVVMSMRSDEGIVLGSLSKNSQHRISIMCTSEAQIDSDISLALANIQSHERMMEALLAKRTCYELTEEQKQSRRKTLHRDMVNFQETLERYKVEKPASLILGDVALSVPYQVLETHQNSEQATEAASVSGLPWVADWALIKMDKSRHPSPICNRLELSEFEFRKPLEEALSQDQPAFSKFQLWEKDIEIYGSIFGDFSMRSPLPERDFFETSQTGTKPLPVFKYGPTTGCTFGFANQLKSVVRQFFPGLGESVISEELCIVNSPSKSVFSAISDSGSVVFDKDRRPVAMITSGSGNQFKDEPGREIDVTYAVPLERLFQHMKSEGLDLEPVEGRINILSTLG